MTHAPSWPKLGRFWTLPNALSLVRLGLAVPVMYLILVDGSVAWILGLCAFAILTDWVDGTLARWTRSVSDWGKVLDPMADKLTGFLVVVALVLRGSLPVWFFVVLLLRDLAIFVGGVIIGRYTGHVVMSVMLGKIAVTSLSITVLAALLKADAPIMDACIWTTVVLMVVSFFVYVGRFVRLMRGRRSAAADLADAGRA